MELLRLFSRAHIQDFHGASKTQRYWGYVDRVIPCAVDAGSCEYLDAVYGGHEISMLYSFIMWAVIGGVLLIWGLMRAFKPQPSQKPTVVAADAEAGTSRKSQGILYRTVSSIRTLGRRWLLPESFYRLFGHVSRLQIAILAVMSGYLFVFTMVGIVYKKWVTPVKGLTGVFNTRTGLGPWSDRIGVMAYALTPLTIALSTRESILSLITGVPYQHFNFLHRWTGRIIFVQSFMHTLGWTLIEARLYQPQPKVWNGFIIQGYIIWGIIAMLFITWLTLMSTRAVIRITGYEFFRKTHYLVAALYLGACWAHWLHLACWMIASIGLMFLDRGLRLLRIAFLHLGYKNGNRGFGWRNAQAKIQCFEDSEAEVVRLDFEFNHDPWKLGQHFYLCFPELSVWQSHPMTPASVPARHPEWPRHTYIIRAMKGETAKLARLAKAKQKQSAADEKVNVDMTETTPVILTGPYGGEPLSGNENLGCNVLAIAGGTGISFALPMVLATTQDGVRAADRNRVVELVWIIRKTQNLEWILPELLELKARIRSGFKGLRVKIFITRCSKPGGSTKSLSDRSEEVAPTRSEKDHTTLGKSEIAETSISAVGAATPTSERDLTSGLHQVLAEEAGFEIEWLKDHHPNLCRDRGIVDSFMERAKGTGRRTMVVASGPSGLGKDLRIVVADANDAGKVWKGEEGADVGFYWDDRLG